MISHDPESPLRTTGGRRPRLSLRVYIAMLLAIAIAPIGAIGIVQTVVAQRENDALRVEALINATVEATGSETRALAEAFGTLRTLADLVPRHAGSAACDGFLSAVVANQPRYVLAVVTDREGALRCASDAALARQEVGIAPLHAEMVDKQRPLARSFQGAAFGPEPVLNLAVPLYDGAAFDGMLLITLPRGMLHVLAHSDRARNGSGRRDALFDSTGYVFAQSTEQRGDLSWLPDAATLREQALREPRQAFRFTPGDGVTRTYVTVPVVTEELFAVASWPTQATDLAASVRLALAVVFPIAMWMVGTAIAFFAMNALLLRNVLKLGRVMSAFARGRRSVRMTPAEGAPSEIVALGESFNRLADRIEADETAMANAIEEKNTLLREVYHRVKNNLQLIVSMMNLQIRQAPSEAERAALKRLQARVQGLALVHQRLYLAQNLAAVRMDLLLEDLMTHISEIERGVSDLSDRRIEADPLVLEPDRAVPVALFASEAITNAFKHGLALDEPGRLSVRLAEEGDGMVRLEIANTVSREGRDGQQAAEGGRLGMRLLESFARQVGGRVERNAAKGEYRIALVFPELSIHPRQDDHLPVAAS